MVLLRSASSRWQVTAPPFQSQVVGCQGQSFYIDIQLIDAEYRFVSKAAGLLDCLAAEL